jgi:sugar phosphate isomerase/epimerase
MTIDRRTFLGILGAAMLATRSARAASIPRLGVQLYTVRGLLEKDFDGTLAQVAALGFTEVEFAGYFKRTAQQVRDVLTQHKLTAPAAHVPYDNLTGDAWARIIDDARTVGHRYLVNAWVDESIRKQPDAWKRIAETYNRAGEAS